MGCNRRHADDIICCAESPEDAKSVIGKVNNKVKSRLLKLNVKHTERLKIGKIQFDAGIIVDDEQIEVVEHFKYLGSLKSADGLKLKWLDLVPIWRARGMNPKMKLDRSLVWTVLTY